jgi:hypothetical protein
MNKKLDILGNDLFKIVQASLIQLNDLQKNQDKNESGIFGIPVESPSKPV